MLEFNLAMIFQLFVSPQISTHYVRARTHNFGFYSLQWWISSFFLLLLMCAQAHLHHHHRKTQFVIQTARTHSEIMWVFRLRCAQLFYYQFMALNVICKLHAKSSLFNAMRAARTQRCRRQETKTKFSGPWDESKNEMYFFYSHVSLLLLDRLMSAAPVKIRNVPVFSRALE